MRGLIFFLKGFNQEKNIENLTKTEDQNRLVMRYFSKQINRSLTIIGSVSFLLSCYTYLTAYIDKIYNMMEKVLSHKVDIGLY